eukprot:CAMPEP_0183420666 /NCGR_PEP_ID=MMETSP0370-20130417/26602_1 /TAXON_ID=268820 /ORGANISM="Peridinium aciculiferum, Strain PAER-2" /LENGTH=182 /DNA_ID=CAMNT_0025604569 /DNA_START=70 /DNA_END=618 /DNA_ORIENTATION=+
MARRSPLASVLALVALASTLASWWFRSCQQPSGFVSGFSAVPRHTRVPAVAMQSEKVDAIVASLKELTLLEASELVKAIEETFGVDASASGGGMMMMAAAAGPAEEVEEKVEKTEFDLILKEVPKDKKIACIKVVRTLLELGLKEAKERVDDPGKLMEAQPKAKVEEAMKLLMEAGAKCEIV